MSRAATVSRPSASQHGAAGLKVPAVPTVPAQRSRRRGSTAPASPLGSLTQQPAGVQTCCHACGGAQVTRLEMQLTDGTPVQFTSCHRCEARRWDHDGVEMSVQTVLERTRKLA